MAEKEGGFKVVDRRHFQPDGTPRQDEPPPEPREPAAQAQGPATGSAYHVGEAADAFGPLDFPQFILSLAQLAFSFLGDLPNPQTGRRERNVAAAKQQIDLLSMLRDKTRGNLTPDEDRLLASLLYELQMRFVEVVEERQGQTSGRS